MEKRILWEEQNHTNTATTPFLEKEDPNNKQPEYTRYSEDEEQVLDLNELMDVQGGIDDKELSKCGLGCYTGGFVDPTKTQDENTGNE